MNERKLMIDQLDQKLLKLKTLKEIGIPPS